MIRYLTQDDVKQSKKASHVIESKLNDNELGYITLITLMEIIWVLESCYDQKKPQLLAILQALLSTKQPRIEGTDAVHLALKRYAAANCDFSDNLITVVSELDKCSQVVTFDKKAITAGMTLL